ncbi:MAG TPA: MaoC family dehydratase N-terminal domain-containing protein [Ktedonobacteraceae bacterium]|jgi:acyl dehydratase
MFDKDKIGHSFSPFTIEIERGKIHELALSLGDHNPIYHSREAAQAAGYEDIPLFPTTPTMFNFWGNPHFVENLVSLGLNVMRILHLEEEYEYVAPVYPGDVLTGVSTVVDGKTRQNKNSSMDILTMETRYSSQHNQLVVIARMTLVVREEVFS